MFEQLTRRAAELAEARVRRRRAAIAAAATDEAPAGVRIEAGAEGVVLAGRGLRARWVRDGALRAAAEAGR